MDLFALTRRLVDIESITPNEGAVGNFLCDDLRRRSFESAAMPVEGARANILATWPGHPRPEIVFSTHMDTVPPFIPSSEDDTSIYGRGSCDAKGIIAAQVIAAEKLLAEARPVVEAPRADAEVAQRVERHEFRSYLNRNAL